MPKCKQCGALLALDVVVLFCSECGQSINIDRKVSELKTNLKTLNMKKYLFLTFIPFLNLIAAYKLGRFKHSLARIIPDLLILFIILINTNWPLQEYFSVGLRSLDVYTGGREIVLIMDLLSTIIVLWIIPSMVMFYFIRRWIMEWNNRVAFFESLQSKTD